LSRSPANVSKCTLSTKRGSANKGNPSDTEILFREEPRVFPDIPPGTGLDILRNATNNPTDRVKEFSFMAGGGTYTKLFDGTEKLLRLGQTFLWINRSVCCFHETNPAASPRSPRRSLRSFQGLVDVHVHSDPDSVPRRLDAWIRHGWPKRPASGRSY